MRGFAQHTNVRRCTAAGLVAIGALLPSWLGGGTADAVAATGDTSSTRSASRILPTWTPHLRRYILPTVARTHGMQRATYYGPGLWGNRTACGKTLLRTTWGIAHRTLPCGTLVTIHHSGRRVAVRVIDRGPYSGANVDLTKRTSDFLRFTSRGVGDVRLTVIKQYRPLAR